MSIMHCPLATALYIKYCKGHNHETLRDIYHQYDDFNSQAFWYIRESFKKQVSSQLFTFNLLPSWCKILFFIRGILCKVV